MRGVTRDSRCPEADAFSMAVVQDFDGVAINYPDYSSGEVFRLFY